MTLLEMVQNILYATEADEVNSITDTAESEQVAEVLKEVYFQILNDDSYPSHFELFKLDGVGNTSTPNYLKLPSTVRQMEWWKYNKKKVGATREDFEYVPYKTPLEFIDLVHKRDSSLSTVSSVQDISNGVTLLIENDTAPNFWTSFDNEYIVTDAYDSAIDSTLQSSKTLAWGILIPSWTADDDFIPDLDASFFPFLLAEAKSTIFVNQKQIVNAKVDGQARKQEVRLQNEYFRTKQAAAKSRNNYGRK